MRFLPTTPGNVSPVAPCEKRCPFGVPVIQSMQEAKVLFGK